MTERSSSSTSAHESIDLATLESYRLKSDGVATKTYMDQFECEESCGMFFFPLHELPDDQQLQLQQSGFTNANLEVRVVSLRAFVLVYFATTASKWCLWSWCACSQDSCGKSTSIS